MGEARRQLGRARRRLVRALGGESAGDVPPTTPGVPLAEVLPLLYPDAADADALLRAARSVVGSNVLSSTYELRRLLAALDRQAYPSPVTVRFRRADLATVALPGFEAVVDRADAAVSASLLSEASYEPHVTAVVGRYLQPGMTAVDVGANIGYYTLLFAHLVGTSGRVLSFEPNSENLRLIFAALEANAVANVTVVPLALDAARGWSYFTSHVGSNGGLLNEDASQFVDGGGWIVATAALDEVVEGPVDFLKMDVEGGEGRVLAGAIETLRRCRPIVVSEFSCEMLRRVSGTDPLEYLSTFTELGYQLHVIDRSRPGELEDACTPAALLSTWSDDLRVADLLFLPA